MENPAPQKQGMGALAWIGIGCGGIVALLIVGFLVVTFMFGGKIKQFAEDVQKDPVRTMATTAVSLSGGQIEMVAQDEAGKRYTIKDKRTGKLTTMYWDEKKQAPEVIEGDFSAIPIPIPAPDSAPVPAPQ